MEKVDMDSYFLNKFVSCSIGNDIYEIDNPKFELQHEKLFLVGTIPKGVTNNDWAEGKKCAVAWDKVTDYMVFDSVDDYIKSSKLDT